MIFTTPNCPECGEQADGTLEQVTGRAFLDFDEETGDASYMGETEIFWDDQRFIIEYEGTDQATIRLLCHNGHDWGSTFTGELS